MMDLFMDITPTRHFDADVDYVQLLVTDRYSEACVRMKVRLVVPWTAFTLTEVGWVERDGDTYTWHAMIARIEGHESDLSLERIPGGQSRHCFSAQGHTVDDVLSLATDLEKGWCDLAEHFQDAMSI